MAHHSSADVRQAKYDKYKQIMFKGSWCISLKKYICYKNYAFMTVNSLAPIWSSTSSPVRQGPIWGGPTAGPRPVQASQETSWLSQHMFCSSCRFCSAPVVQCSSAPVLITCRGSTSLKLCVWNAASPLEPKHLKPPSVIFLWFMLLKVIIIKKNKKKLSLYLV